MEARSVSTVAEFDTRLFTEAAVMNAAYRVSDRLEIDIALVEHGLIRCRLQLRRPNGQSESHRLDRAVADFKREVLDQQLRERVRAETQQVRNLILAHTFSRTGYASGE